MNMRIKLNGAYYIKVKGRLTRVLVLRIREEDKPIYSVMDLETLDQFEIHQEQFECVIPAERQFE